MFYFDVRDINWNQYLEKYVLGTRQFVLEEDATNLLEAKKKKNR